MNNLKTINEVKNLNLSIEDICSRYSTDEEDYYMINKYPYSMWMHPFIRSEININDRITRFRSDRYLTKPEEIDPKKFTLVGHKWIIEDKATNPNLILLKSGRIPLHYSTNPRVWELDYNNLLNKENIQDRDVEFPLPTHLVQKFSEKLTKWCIKYTSYLEKCWNERTEKFDLLTGNIILRVRLGRRNYRSFRQFLLDIQVSIPEVAILYDYGEIRAIFDNSGEVVYI